MTEVKQFAYIFTVTNPCFHPRLFSSPPPLLALVIMAVFPLDDSTRDDSSHARSGLDLQFLNRLRSHWDGLLS